MAESRPGGLTCAEATELVPGLVLGALEPDEAAAVRAHLAGCSAVHQEVDDLGSTAAVLLESVPLVEPPDELRARLLRAAAASQALAPAGAAAGGQARSPALQQAPPAGAARQRATRIERAGGRWTWDRLRTARPSVVLGMAAAIAIFVLGAWSVSLQQRLNEADRFANAVAAALDLARQPGSVTAVLAPATAGGPSGLAAVGADGSVSIAVQGLAPTPGREVYEAWAIGRDGATVPIGGFSVGPDGVGTLSARARPANETVAVALTRERGPGATAPTLPILLSGPTAARSG